MNLADTLRILTRRKGLLVLLVLISGALTVAAFVKTPPEYEATASLVVLAPTEIVGEAAEGPVNPFLNFGGSQDTAAQVLQVRMSDDEVGKQLEELGVEGEWEFEIQGGGGPLGVVTVIEPSKKAAIQSAHLIVAAAQTQFADMQRLAGSPEPQLVRLSELTAPTDPATVYKNKLRNAAVVFVLSLGLSALIIFGTEGVARSNERRRAMAAQPEELSRGPVAHASKWQTSHEADGPPPIPRAGPTDGAGLAKTSNGNSEAATAGLAKTSNGKSEAATSDEATTSNGNSEAATSDEATTSNGNSEAATSDEATTSNDNSEVATSDGTKTSSGASAD